MAKLTPWLEPHRSDRERWFTVAVDVDVAVKILLVVAVRRVERTARQARQAPTPITVDASCACAVDLGHLRDRLVGAWIMVS